MFLNNNRLQFSPEYPLSLWEELRVLVTDPDPERVSVVISIRASREIQYRAARLILETYSRYISSLQLPNVRPTLTSTAEKYQDASSAGIISVRLTVVVTEARGSNKTLHSYKSTSSPLPSKKIEGTLSKEGDPDGEGSSYDESEALHEEGPDTSAYRPGKGGKKSKKQKKQSVRGYASNTL